MKAIPAILLVVVLAGCGKGGDKDKDEGKGKGGKSKPETAAAVPPDAAPAPPPSSAPDAAPVTAKPNADAVLRDAVLQALHEAAHCDVTASPWRPWCVAADGWAKAAEAPLPAGALAMVGLSLELETGKPMEESLQNDVYLSALALDGGAGKAKIIRITGSEPGEQQAIAEAVAGLAIVLKGNAASAALPPDLAAYVGTVAAQASHPLTRAGAGWTWTGDMTGELRKVGDYWVAIEVPAAKNGHVVSIFTDKVR